MTLPQTPSFRLDGKSALVTGASSGIGAACAVALAQAGAHVFAAARRGDKLEGLAKDVQAEGGKMTPVSLDVTDHDAMATFIEEKGPFDILLNSAGMARHSPSMETTEGDFDAVVDINLKSAYFLSQRVAKGLIKASKPGSIINISSQMALVGGIERAVYSATKAGVEGFTRGMAIELGPHQIRINTICPTFIVTALTQASFDDPVKREWIESKIKLGRVGEVEDIMGAAVFLASDAAALITGTALVVDGGWTAD
ncbi:MAG: SDR family oxidoreductase [Alphaproteobacteria bacterium]|nr:SDR family oxidoreductase [Alphaproteobacteria bacterium]